MTRLRHCLNQWMQHATTVWHGDGLVNDQRATPAPRSLLPLIPSLRNDRRDLPHTKPPTTAWGAVPFVGNEPLRPASPPGPTAYPSLKSNQVTANGSSDSSMTSAYPVPPRGLVSHLRAQGCHENTDTTNCHWGPSPSGKPLSPLSHRQPYVSKPRLTFLERVVGSGRDNRTSQERETIF